MNSLPTGPCRLLTAGRRLSIRRSTTTYLYKQYQNSTNPPPNDQRIPDLAYVTPGIFIQISRDYVGDVIMAEHAWE